MAGQHRYYSAFAWTIGSDDEIPDFIPSASPRPSDLHIRLGTLPECASGLDIAKLKLWHSTVETTPEGRPHKAIWRIPDTPYFLLEYFDGHRFVFNREATEVWCWWPADSTKADNLCYLLGPVIGILLTLREVTCLHASCVQIGEGCYAIVGAAEAGKSTTVAAFALRGRTIVSDDITTLERENGQVVVRPAYPRVRLWPEAAAVLQVPLGALPALTPNWDKRYLDLRGEGFAFARSPVPLQGIYVLQERGDEERRPYLEESSPRQRMLDLLANMYVAALPDEGRTAREFPLLHEIASQLPVRRVFPHSAPARLRDLCELIEEDVASRSAKAARASHV